MVHLGDWAWPAPCRVPVRETIGGDGIPVERTFTLAITPDPSGVADLVLSFDEIAISGSATLTETQLVAEILRYGALLPSMRLDSEGRFVGFVDLAASLDDAINDAGGDVELAMATAPEVVDNIVRGTVETWYGLWQDHDSIPLETLAETSTRPFGSDSYATDVRIFAEGPFFRE